MNLILLTKHIMEIRDITIVDENVIKAFNKLLPQLANDIQIPSKEYLQSLANSENTHLIIAYDGDIVIGTTTLIINKLPSGIKAWIEDVIVDDSIRGKGIGKQLVNFAINLAKDKGIKKIDLTSNPQRVAANGLYIKLGLKKRETNMYRLTVE